jgi:hypothetical protein
VVCEIDRDAGYRLSDGTFRFGITRSIRSMR